MRFLSFAIAIIFISSAAIAQTGPGGVGANNGATSLRHWYRADANITASGGAISQWGDASGYNNHLVQGTPASSPTTSTNASLNGQPIVRYSGAQFFTSSASGPGTDNLAIFLVARGTSYQSLVRFQNSGATFVVYPWELGSPARSFISSSDGGTGGGIASGLVDNTNNIGLARYRRNTINGMQTYLNGTLVSQKNSVNSVLPSQLLWSGRYSGGGEFPNADVGEMIVFYSALNDAQLVIVQNYLAAKFNATLAAGVDAYTMDDTGNGDFDYDVAGIGRTSSTSIQDDSRGTGFIRILNPTDLNDGEYFMWGHNNLTAVAGNTTDIPSGVTARFNRVWRVSEPTGDVGNVDMQIDVTGLSDFTSLSTCDAAASIRLLIDTNNDGNFADQTPISGATNIGGNVYRFANVTPVNNGNRFTIAIVSQGVTGPGGVGATNGTGALALWMDAGKGITSTAGAVTQWADQSGRGINAVAPAVAARPTYSTNVVNGQPVVNFLTNDMLELSTNINTTTPSMFMVGNKTSPGTGYMTFLTLQQNLWLAQGSSVDQWGMYVINDALVANLNTTYRVMSTIERNFNDIDLYNAETGVTRTNGTAHHGKAIGAIGANNNGTTNTGLQFFNGNIAELVVFNSNVNSAQRIIISNYLAAKYGLTLLAASDLYTRDNVANGNFDFEMAGIGRVSSTSLHNDARGSGIVRISNPTSLGDGDYFMWGHNGSSLAVFATTTSDVPAGIQSRWNRQWAVSEVNEVGSIDIQFDMTGQGSVTASDLRLLIDHDDDGVYNEAGTIQQAGAIALSCNNYMFSSVSSINNAMRFTLGTVNKSQTPLPIELISFEAEASNGVTELKWETANEFNNDFFTVERSETGEKFTALFDVKGAGTSTTNQKYSSFDRTAPEGDLYYRLKQTDFNGIVTYSKIVHVFNENLHSKFVISPNPVAAGEVINVGITNFNAQAYVDVTLYDMLGRSIPLTYERSENGVNVSTAAVRSPGIYVLTIITAADRHTEKIFISE